MKTVLRTLKRLLIASKLSIMLLSLFFCSSFSYGQSSLAYQMANDSSLQNAGQLLENTINLLPNKRPMKFDQNRVRNLDMDYISEFTGIPLAQIESLYDELQPAMFTYSSKYRSQLLSLSEQQRVELYTEVKNIIMSGSNLGNSNLVALLTDPCGDCKRTGRSRIAYYTILGGVGCASGGLFWIWGCATLGFWHAANETLDCLRANGCK